MVFTSLQFLLFFPAVVLLYWAFPVRRRWVWLLAASACFYLCWNPKYAVFLLFSILTTYLAGRLIDWANKLPDRRRLIWKRLTVVGALLCNIGVLFFFKYFDFALENLNAVLKVFHFAVIQPKFDVILPLGISFYTFQAVGYVIDVYRGNAVSGSDGAAEKNLARYALFVSFFPQVLSGPIGRAGSLLPQLEAEHRFDYEQVKSGLLLILWGFFQKLVVADRIALFVNEVYGHYNNYPGFPLVLATVLYAVQIYCDFAGYSDIARGAARVMGIELIDNFKRPYFARSVADFWRRWHISLSSWLRDYVYIPLGGSRCAKWKKYRNVMITFLVSGLWHGASWNYVAWGLLHGFYQIFGAVTKPIRNRIIQKLHINPEWWLWKCVQILTTFLLVDFAWIFFRAPGGQVAVGILQSMIARSNLSVLWNGGLYQMGLSKGNWAVLILSVAMVLIVSLLRRKHVLAPALSQRGVVLRWAFYFAALYAVLILGIYGPGYEASAFIYFQY